MTLPKRTGQAGRRTQIILIGTALTALTKEQNARQNGGYLRGHTTSQVALRDE
jgi:hypothetical protein